MITHLDQKNMNENPCLNNLTDRTNHIYFWYFIIDNNKFQQDLSRTMIHAQALTIALAWKMV